uniref:Uncharacterized protein n=1 Tax=uncultured marine virus TaxID=186617 RepID=A0A0F7L5A0_9VIRU|nr:hypothetical protein [uncultured marine virus]
MARSGATSTPCARPWWWMPPSAAADPAHMATWSRAGSSCVTSHDHYLRPWHGACRVSCMPPAGHDAGAIHRHHRHARRGDPPRGP